MTIACGIVEPTTISSIEPTSVTDIFLPHGSVLYNNDFATLKININLTNLFKESKSLCEASHLLKGFIRQRAAKLKLSAPNLRIFSTLVQRIHNICDETQQIMMAIKSTLGLTEMDGDSEEKRQVILAVTAVVSSLVTYFTTKQLVTMGLDDGDDELIDTTNHLMTAIQNHETRIARVESRQKELDTKLDKLTEILVLGIRMQDMFATIYSISTHSGEVAEHLKKITIGLMDGLMLSSDLHPNLVNASILSDGISRLREKALAHSKELVLENNADNFMSKADFAAFPNGNLKILVHLHLIDASNKLKLYQHIYP